ncbi:MAG: GDSL-family lipase/acylhydrolase [Lachnospiraceae bacterium]|jgi:hypothetical protein|nr:GDSL-family lipase/acylhydrolase [Lachnospiraceae bacterium]
MLIRKNACSKIILGLIIFSAILINLNSPIIAKASSSNNYLVLVQNSDKTWTAYEDVMERSLGGNLMIQAKPIALALNMKYIERSDGTFSIKRSTYRYNTYTIGERKYSFKSSSTLSTVRTAVYAPYISHVSGKALIHSSTINSMVYNKYFSIANAAEFRAKGYRGVACFSIYGEITEVPSIDEVVNSFGEKYFEGTDLVEVVPIDQETENQGSGSSGSEWQQEEEKLTYQTENKLIFVGDSRFNNMSRWVQPSVNSEFIAKNGIGYEWFLNVAIDEVTELINPGDVIIVWLGVNDYYSTSYGSDSWLAYAETINNLANEEWADCKVYVSEVGYVDSNLIYDYYGKYKMMNVSQLGYEYEINGIQEFNEKLKSNLNENITWIDTNAVIGINNNDYELTPASYWLTRGNGKKDGIHYGKDVSVALYNHFVDAIFK